MGRTSRQVVVNDCRYLPGLNELIDLILTLIWSKFGFVAPRLLAKPLVLGVEVA